MTSTLWTPSTPEDLYDERRDVANDEDVDPLLPYFQGDVFIGVALPGVDDLAGDQALGMLVGHPCSMLTSNGQYQERLEVVRVRPTRTTPFDKWPTQAFETQPLPELNPAELDVSFAAHFHERGLIATSDLQLRNRIATLSLDGVVCLQQRLIHESSRVVVSPYLLEQQTRPRYLENQLAREWNAKLITDPEMADPDVLTMALSREAEVFDSKLGAVRKLKDAESDYVHPLDLRKQLFYGEFNKVRQAMNRLRWQEEQRRKDS